MTTKELTEQQKLEELQYQQKVQDNLAEELKKNSKPMFLTKAFVDKPFIVVAICAFFFIICIVLTGAAELGSMSDSTNRDYLIWDHERTQDYDQLVQAQEEFQKGLQNTVIPVQSIQIDKWSTFIVLKDKDEENVMTPENIKFLYKIEQQILKEEKYKKFCLASTTSTACSGDFYSITKYFNNPESVTQGQIDQALDEIINDEILYATYKGLMQNTFKAGNAKSMLLRSMFLFGGPIEIDGKRYKDIFDDELDQEDKFKDFSQTMLDIIIDEDNGLPDKTQILPFSQIMSNIIMQQIADSDLTWAIGSILFVVFYMAIHLRSMFLSSMSMLSILLSFPITLVIFGLVFQISYFSTLHILVVFIVLGIAADNVFVFTDAWKQTETYDVLEGDLNKRMAVTFRRASKAMLATSSTTGAAFLSTGLSPIMPISSFGFFAGILIPVNFILVITFYPAILIIFEKYTKNMCVCKNKKTQENNNNTNNNNNEQNQQIDNQDIEQNQINEKQNEQKTLSKVEIFFGTTFNDYVFKLRYPIILIFLIWTCISIWRTTELPSLSEPEQFLPDDHEISLAQNHMRYDFHVSGNSDTGIKVYHYWGVEKLNTDDVGVWDPEDLGEIVWDKNFDLSPEANQQYIYDICVDYETLDLVVDGLVDCFMIHFKTFIEDQGKTFPVNQNQFMSELQDFTVDPVGAKYYNENVIGIINGELKYFSIELSAEGVPFSPYKQLNPIYEKWDDHIKKINKNAPKGLQNSKQTALMGWVFMITEKAFSSSAVQGTLISLAFAFAVLIFTTHNIVVAFYSTITIIGIVTSVITVMELSGWELGVAESIAIVILIGMSVDYVVHLANHYVESPYPDRFRKMKISLQDLGISIISGASTTIGSGIFLFFAVLTIFNKFAILIVSTISFSLAYALIFFSALIHIIGPENDCGNILVLFRKKKTENTPSVQTAGQEAQIVDKQISVQDGTALQNQQ